MFEISVWKSVLSKVQIQPVCGEDVITGLGLGHYYGVRVRTLLQAENTSRLLHVT